MSSTQTQKLQVLVVDDEPDLRELIEYNLTQSGHAVSSAGDGITAIELALSTVPDVIVLDVMMPGLNGIEVAKRLRNQTETASIPIIMLTAKAEEIHELEGLDAGADDYITKPFAIEELRARLAGLIRSREQLRTRFSKEIIVQPSNVIAQAEDEVFLKKVLSVIEAHLGNSAFGAELLADELGISSRHLSRRLRTLTGKPPAALIRHFRLERAMQLLEKRVGTIAEVAYRVGFKSSSHFSTAFRKAYGKTPKAFMEKQNENFL